MSKIQVLYIVSNGRSGSTLLQMLLNLHKNIFTVGEIQELPNELKKMVSVAVKGKFHYVNFGKKF